MKNRHFLPLLTALSLGALPFAGCTQQAAQVSPLITTAQAEPAEVLAQTNSPEANTNPEPLAAVPEITPATAPEPVPGAEQVMASAIRANSPTLDVVKLAQAGVDQTVILTFITNTHSMFLLSSDEIVYLNDIGVPGEVVTAMMQRDQQTRQNWSSAPPVATTAAPATTANEVQAAPPATAAQPAPADTAPTVVNNNYFYDTLSPYGSWVEIEGYGRCWQPTVVVANRSWRPYCDGGRWVYTDAGWYWLSDYSWGATTFHYGRWFYHSRWGWCWWPDTIWGPSWVTFRYSGDYCGWAPLPPFSYYRTGLGFVYYGRSVGFGFDFGLGSSWFTFVSWNRFCDPHPWHYRARPHEVANIYTHTTIVNNYASGDHHGVINRGINPDRVRQFGRTEVKVVKLRDERSFHNDGARRERLERDGRTLSVNRPSMPMQREGSKNVEATSAKPGIAATPSAVRPSPRGATSSVNQPLRRERPEVTRTTSPAQSVAPRPVSPTPSGPTQLPSSTGNRERPGNFEQRGRGSRPGAANQIQPSGAAPASQATLAQPAAPTPVVTQPSFNREQSRPSSVIVVGKSISSPSTAQRAFPVYTSPQSPSRPVVTAPVTSGPVTQPSSPASAATTPAPAPPTRTWGPRQEAPQTIRSYSPPSLPSRSERPTFSPRPATPTPAPSYTPPVINTPRPTPSVAPTAPSSPALTPRPAPETRPAPSTAGRGESGRRPGH